MDTTGEATGETTGEPLSTTHGPQNKEGPPTPLLSVIIPIHNEEEILCHAVEELLDGVSRWRPELSFEVILAENGSRDNTLTLARSLGQRHPQVRALELAEPNYGAALRKGILKARGKWVICDEIDLCDLDFYERALTVLESGDVDLVVGSKAMPGARDARPLTRRLATKVINGMLRVLLGFTGTDTHGLKAFKRQALLDVARRCVVDKDLFASEFVIRAERSNLRVREIPIEVEEKRPPSVDLFRRVPNVLKNMATLFYALRIHRGGR